MAAGIYPLLARGVFATFGYFVVDEGAGRGVLVDPGAQPRLFLEAARERGWKIDAILLTHGHFDHMGAAGALSRAWGAPIMAHELAKRYLLDPALNLSAEYSRPIRLSAVTALSDGDCISIGDADSLEVLHVPGHTDDSCAYLCAKRDFALVGDTAYAGGPGLTVFPTGNDHRLRESICKRILTLPPETVLLSGHSSPMTVAQLRVAISQPACGNVPALKRDVECRGTSGLFSLGACG